MDRRVDLATEMEVAPRAGAWIETLGYLHQFMALAESLPVRERGLKPRYSAISRTVYLVAPRAGAWIETVTVAPSKDAIAK